MNETALIVISEEAELLIPVIRAERQPKVHLIAYAAAITKNTLHFNELSYYVLPRLPVGYKAPSWLSIELGIFAGRLYLNFPEYASLMRYLQLTDKTNSKVQQNSVEQVCVFTKSPVSFLLEWLTLRRKGQNITNTPMGYVCQRRPLHQSHPFFEARRAGAEDVIAPSVEGRRKSGKIRGAEEGDTDFEDEWDPMDQPD